MKKCPWKPEIRRPLLHLMRITASQPGKAHNRKTKKPGGCRSLALLLCI